jgi:hypothetical protein
MANFMKKQFLVYNNDAVENNVIANQLKELSNNQLEVEDPNELLTTNSILKAYGVQLNQNRNNSKKPTKKKFKK